MTQNLLQHLFSNERRRWTAVGILAVLTFGAHAWLTIATPNPTTGSPNAVDFHLPIPAAGGSTAATESTATTSRAARSAAATVHTGPVSLSANLDRDSVLRGSDGEVYAEVLIHGEGSPTDHRVPTDLMVVLDHSGSMAGTKIRQARDAAIDLLSRLDPEDRFALIGFSSHAEVLIPPAPAGPAHKARWRSTIHGIESGGGTNMVDALDKAVQLLKNRSGSERPCRVLLLSDGHPNTTEGLDHLARTTGRRGATLSALGFGADFNEVLMGSLADFGAGNYYFVDQPEILAQVFAEELEAGRTTVAKQLELHLRPSAGVTLTDAAGYPIERRDGAYIVKPGDLFAEQTRRIWLRMDVETEHPFESRSLGELKVSFQADGQAMKTETLAEFQVACVDDRERYLAGIDGDAWGRAVVSEEYGALQDQVAGLVREGRQEEAKKQIESYVVRQSTRNAAIQNADVSANLAEVEKLKEEVEQAFQGPDQVQRQNVMSKQKLELSKQLRRIAPSSKGGRK